MAKFFPIQTRKAVLKLYNAGEVTNQKICKRHKISVSLLRTWSKATGIERGGKLTWQEIEQRIKKWCDDTMAKEGVQTAIAKKTPQGKRELLKLKKQFGNQESLLPEGMQPLGLAFDASDPSTWNGMLAEHLNRAVAELERGDASPRGQAIAMLKASTLLQLRNIVENPPPILTVGDMEKLFKMLDGLFGVSVIRKDSDSDGADMRILNGKVPPKGKIQEAQVVKPLAIEQK